MVVVTHLWDDSSARTVTRTITAEGFSLTAKAAAVHDRPTRHGRRVRHRPQVGEASTRIACDYPGEGQPGSTPAPRQGPGVLPGCVLPPGPGWRSDPTSRTRGPRPTPSARRRITAACGEFGGELPAPLTLCRVSSAQATPAILACASLCQGKRGYTQGAASRDERALATDGCVFVVLAVRCSLQDPMTSWRKMVRLLAPAPGILAQVGIDAEGIGDPQLLHALAKREWPVVLPLKEDDVLSG